MHGNLVRFFIILWDFLDPQERDLVPILLVEGLFKDCVGKATSVVREPRRTIDLVHVGNAFSRGPGHAVAGQRLPVANPKEVGKFGALGPVSDGTTATG